MTNIGPMRPSTVNRLMKPWAGMSTDDVYKTVQIVHEALDAKKKPAEIIRAIQDLYTPKKADKSTKGEMTNGRRTNENTTG